MSETFKNLEKFKEGLTAAYQSKTTQSGPLESSWRQNVMRSIRQIGPIQQKVTQRSGFSILAWRLAPAALTLMIILAVLIFRVGNSLDYQLAGLMVSDPVQTYITYEPL